MMAEEAQQTLTALVIGGSGFIGSHVADHLTDAGHRVRVYDRVESPWLQDGQEICIGELADRTALCEAIDGCDVVYNFAALADLERAMDRPVETVEVNVLGNVYALEACRQFGVRRFLYASTVYVSGREGGFYRASKLAAEEYVVEYRRAYGLEHTILRFGSLYGPRSDVNNGLRRIVAEAISSGTVRYVGSPEAVREYIHVEDAARASVAALAPEFADQRVVLSGREAIRVLDVLEMVSEILGLEGEVEFVDGELAGHYVRTPYSADRTLSRKFTPNLAVDLGQGLVQLVEDVRADLAG
jgi:UDP-glucose 4-epimerase